MSKRFANLLDLSEDDAWDMVFNEEQQMSGHQSKYQHILDRTMLRPRDMIKFCNESLDAYRSDPHENGKIENIHLNKARDSYSDYLLAEVDDEIHKHISEWDKCVELLRQLDAVTFERQEWEKICVQRRDLMPADYNAVKLLTDLFGFSVIGYYQAGGRGY